MKTWMANSPSQHRLTIRDREVLAVLDRCPLTIRQLLKVSQVFQFPFTSERRARERLQALREDKFVHRWTYAALGKGAPNYYTLSRQGHRWLHDNEPPPVPKRAFGPIGIALQHHSHALAEFVTHVTVAAHKAGWMISGFCRENSVRLTVDHESFYPDCCFQLVAPGQAPQSFLVEIDNRSERIRSDYDRDSWQRKIRLYESFRHRCPTPFRVLIVPTRGRERLGRILEVANLWMAPTDPTLFCGACLDDLLAENNAAVALCFRNEHGRPTSLIPHSPHVASR